MKRLLDVVGAAVGLLVLSPLLLVVAVLIRWQLGSPVFFRQMRPGLHGKPFELIKFRTMRDAVDEAGNLLPDAERITRLGRFLRSSSIDELPELWNVLKGEMSLVGPRPLLLEYMDYYSEEEQLRHTVRPGITGLAQIQGRNAITWNDKLSFDVEYVRTMSFRGDLLIILKTILKVIKKENILDAAPQGSFSDYRRSIGSNNESNETIPHKNQ
ncbi:sugar transferase [Castellaniella sp.]|uniref:sugar transferase n=1 Tax=Castellaniella sp. TaxID=1955812 RepID=UPI00356964DA